MEGSNNRAYVMEVAFDEPLVELDGLSQGQVLPRRLVEATTSLDDLGGIC